MPTMNPLVRSRMRPSSNDADGFREYVSLFEQTGNRNASTPKINYHLRSESNFSLVLRVPAIPVSKNKLTFCSYHYTDDKSNVLLTNVSRNTKKQRAHSVWHSQLHINIICKEPKYSFSFRSITDYKHIDNKHLSLSLQPQWPHSRIIYIAKYSHSLTKLDDQG